MTPENTYIGSVHKHLPPISKLYRMKNQGLYTAGIADCWYSGPVADLWIEWKFIRVPKRDGTVIDFIGGKDPIISVLQQDWIKERTLEGRNVWVGVGSPDGGLLTKAWENSITAGQFRAQMMDRKTMAAQIVRMTGARS